jgi:hypothetical protein
MTLQALFGNFVKPFRKIFLARSPFDLRAWRHSVEPVSGLLRRRVWIESKALHLLGD